MMLDTVYEMIIFALYLIANIYFNMKKTGLLVLLVLFTTVLFSQNETPYYLTNYLFTENFDEIGALKRNDGVAFKLMTLKGDAANFLKIEGDKIVIRQNRAAKLFERPYWDVVMITKVGNGRDEISFRIVQDEFIANGLVAHRGAWNETHPQNSMASLKRAIELGCAASEIDIRMTKDKKIVLNHDRGIQGLEVPESTFEELSKVKLSNGESLPTFEECLKLIAGQNKTRLVVEVKLDAKDTEQAKEFVEAVMKQVADHNAEAWCVYITFNLEALKEIIAHEPTATVAYLSGDKTPAELKAMGCSMLNYNANKIKENLHWIEEARKNGVSLNVWTVNDPKEMLFFLDNNFDRITTDKPEIYLDIMKQKVGL